MLRNQNPRGSACSGIPKEIPLWGVNIRRNVSRIKRLKALSPSKIIPELGGQYDPEYPKSPLAIAIMGRTEGETCQLGMLELYYEIVKVE